MTRKIEVDFGSDSWYDLHQSLFLENMGKLLASWPRVEASIYVLFHVLVRSNYDTTSTIFFHMQGSDDRLVLIRQLCRQQLHQSVIEGDWKRIDERYRLNLSLMNLISSSEIMRVDPDEIKISDMTKFPIFMAPNHLDRRIKYQYQDRIITMEDIATRPSRFLRLAADINEFCRKNIPGYEQEIRSLPPEILLNLQK